MDDDINDEPKLEETSWMPTSLKIALDKEYMPVILLNDDIKKSVEHDCLKCKDVGLTCISKGRKDTSFFICLTTEDNIFVIDTKFEAHVAFLEKLLRKQVKGKLNFYIYKGHEAAYRLSTGYRIDLGNTIDISTLDIFLSMRKQISYENIGQYDLDYFCNQRFKYRDRINLAKYYLDVELPEQGTREEKADLCEYPLSCRAENFIRKMASTTRMIALRILDNIDELTYSDSNNIYSFGARAHDEDFEAFESLDGRSYQILLNRLNRIQSQSQD